MKTALIALAQELGFEICRIAPCGPPPHAAEFRQWLAEGRAGDMAWLARNQDRRTDPQQVVPGARSVIVLGMNYWTEKGEKAEGRRMKDEENGEDGVSKLPPPAEGRHPLHRCQAPPRLPCGLPAAGCLASSAA